MARSLDELVGADVADDQTAQPATRQSSRLDRMVEASMRDTAPPQSSRLDRMVEESMRDTVRRQIVAAGQAERERVAAINQARSVADANRQAVADADARSGAGLPTPKPSLRVNTALGVTVQPPLDTASDVASAFSGIRGARRPAIQKPAQTAAAIALSRTGKPGLHPDEVAAAQRAIADTYAAEPGYGQDVARANTGTQLSDDIAAVFGDLTVDPTKEGGTYLNRQRQNLGLNMSRTAEALGSIITGDDARRRGSELIRADISDKDPLSSVATGIAGSLVDPAFVPLMLTGGAAVRAAPGIGPAMQRMVAAGGGKALAARVTGGALAGAPADAITGAIEGAADPRTTATEQALDQLGTGLVTGPVFDVGGAAIGKVAGKAARNAEVRERARNINDIREKRQIDEFMAQRDAATGRIGSNTAAAGPEVAPAITTRDPNATGPGAAAMGKLPQLRQQHEDIARHASRIVQPDQITDDGAVSIFAGEGRRNDAEAYAGSLRRTLSKHPKKGGVPGATVEVASMLGGAGHSVTVKMPDKVRPSSDIPKMRDTTEAPPAALKAPDAADAPTAALRATEAELGSMTGKRLRDVAVAEGVDISGVRSKDGLVKAIQENRARLSGEAEAQDVPPAAPAAPDVPASATPDAPAATEAADATPVALKAPDAPAAPDAPDATALAFTGSAFDSPYAAVTRYTSRGPGVTRSTFNYWSKPQIERVEGQAGPVGRAIAHKARKALDTSRRIEGKLNDDKLHGLRLASGQSRQSRQAVRELRDEQWHGQGLNRWAVSTFQRAVENDDALARLQSPVARDIVRTYRRLIERTGIMAEQMGLKVIVNGQSVPFVRARDGKRLLRRPTIELLHILEQPNTVAYSDMVTALADANNISRSDVLRELDALRKRGLIRRAPLENMRTLKVFPTSAMINGQATPLLQADPFNAIESLVRTHALRMGYISEFGQDTDIADARSNPWVRRFVESGGRYDDGEALVRSLNGMPVKLLPEGFQPGTTAYETLRNYDTGMSVLRALKLTRAAITNAFESLGNTTAFGGWRRWARAWGEIARNPREAAIETARHGARTVEVMNLLGQPHRRREHFAKLVRDLLGRITLHLPMNELNELHAAVTGLVFARDMKAGRVHAGDRTSLRIMGFTEPEIRAITSGKANPQLYEAVISRMAEVTQGSTSTAAERSMAANSQWYRRLISFDAYGQMKANRLERVHRQLNAAFKSGDPRRIADASKVFARYYFGTAASGAATTALVVMSGKGLAGLGVLAHEIADDPVGFLVESFVYAQFAGPVDAARDVATAVKQGDDPRDPLTRMALPVSAIWQMYQYANNKGRFKDRSELEKALELFEANVPITGPVATVLAAAGLSEKNQALDAAISAYWRYLRQTGKMPKFPDAQPEADHAEFRKHLRRFMEAMRDGRQNDAAKHIDAAVGVKDRKAVARSLLGRRLLHRLGDDEKAELKRRIGANAYSSLEDHDALLEQWSHRVN